MRAALEERPVPSEVFARLYLGTDPVVGPELYHGEYFAHEAARDVSKTYFQSRLSYFHVRTYTSETVDLIILVFCYFSNI